MAGGFSFPPPPPPPPKPAVQSQQLEFDYPQHSGRGGRERGSFEPRDRGGSGRGRGGGQGNSNFEPLGQQHQRPNTNQGPATPGPRERYEASYKESDVASMNPRPPPGSYVNPNFAGPRLSTNADARFQPTGNERSSTNTRPNHAANRRSSIDGPGRTQAGHKRKLDALRGPQPAREKKPGPQTAPSVPSFGAPILPPAPPTTAARNSVQPRAINVPSRTQAGPRTLGLTPKEGIEPDYPTESEDEDVDEEAQFAELGTKLTFEHNGEVMTLNNEADLAAWKEERKKQFPTTNRVSQKQEEAWRIGEERKRLLGAVARLHQAPRNRNAEVKTRLLREAPKVTEEIATPSLPKSPPTSAVLDTEDMEDVREELSPAVTISPEDHMAEMQDAAIRAEIHKSTQESATQQQKPTESKALPGINMDESDDESDIENPLPAPAEVEASAVVNMVQSDDNSNAAITALGADTGTVAPLDSEAESSVADSDNDGPPEQVSSKPRPSAAPDAKRPICRYFSASGMCRDGDSCRFRHELSSKAPSARPAQPQPDKPAYDRFAPKLDPKTNERKSIFERLVEQEEQGDDRLALQVIKALGQAGLFKNPETEVST